MKQIFLRNTLTLLLASTLSFIAGASIASAQASTSLSVLITYDSTRHSCEVTLPTGTISGMIVTDASGTPSCEFDTTSTDSDSTTLGTSVVSSLDSIFIESGVTGTGTTIDTGTTGSAVLPHAPSLLLLANGGSVATVTSIYDAVGISWEVENVAPHTCIGISSPAMPYWGGDFKNPSAIIPVDIPYTYGDTMTTFTTDTTFTLSGCKGFDGTIVPDQSVLVRVGSVTDTTTTDGTTGVGTTTGGTTGAPATRSASWKEY